MWARLLDGEVAVDVSVAGGLGGDRGDAAESKDDLHHGCGCGGGWRVGFAGEGAGQARQPGRRVVDGPAWLVRQSSLMASVVSPEV